MRLVVLVARVKHFRRHFARELAAPQCFEHEVVAVDGDHDGGVDEAGADYLVFDAVLEVFFLEDRGDGLGRDLLGHVAFGVLARLDGLFGLICSHACETSSCSRPNSWRRASSRVG